MSDSDGQHRKSKRYRVSWASRILLPNKRIVAAKVKDVSMGGVGFEVDEPLTKGMSVSVELRPWSQGKRYVVRAKGVITYSMIRSASVGFGCGFKFTSIARDQFDDLTAILKRLDQP
ncbi:MAG: PilZ domain-containing protein [Cellvibrionaceae bacterium]|nr:PilZ domain-containing protein [Cellvibrionaceae bacterium]